MHTTTGAWYLPTYYKCSSHASLINQAHVHRYSDPPIFVSKLVADPPKPTNIVFPNMKYQHQGLDKNHLRKDPKTLLSMSLHVLH